MRVVHLLRERGMGNNVTHLWKQLRELHSEEWLRQVSNYIFACEPHVTCSITTRPHIREALRMLPLPTWKGLLSIYTRDVLLRLPDAKANITSVYGTILKMDSTKKVKC